MELEELAEDDDEETLQLKLQEIQARLKLKALQKKAKQSSDTETDVSRAGSAPLARSNSVAANRAQSRISELREERLRRSKSQSSVHVPVSPVRRAQPAELPRSPQRVLLGIDKGMKASEVSLKRAPSLRRTQDADFQDVRRAGPFLQRPASQISSRASGTTSSSGEDRPKTFSERMAAIRAQETERKEKELRIQKSRSMAFDIDHEQMRKFKETAVELPPASREAPEFSRDEVLNSYSNPSSFSRSKTAPSLRSAMRSTSNGTDTSVTDTTTASSGAPVKKQSKKKTPPADVSESEASQFEPYSSIHLSKRIVPHKELTRILTGKKTFVIPDLLKTVKAPDFSGPDIEEDVVVFAIVAAKSQPLSHRQDPKNANRGKYMILDLTDLKWELNLFLFDSAFEKFWKLTPGTIIAILNPGFMPPPRGQADTGKFSLVLNSDADTILEIGTARDLGFCKSVKKDGSTCNSWVNKKHTEFCDFHVNLSLKKTHSNRMEVNTMNFGKGLGLSYGARKFNSKDMTGFAERRQKTAQEKRTRYDQESHSQIYIGNRTTASLLDDPDYDPDAFHRSTKEERITRRLLEQEKERELARKLGALGGGLGADYLRKKGSSSSQQEPGSSSNSNSNTDVAQEQAAQAQAQAPPPPPDAAALGLLSGKAKDVQLSPIKRKRVNTPYSGGAAVGWGGNLTKELGRMRDGESFQPVRKKTRFVTAKGIREAGRESFGGDAVISATAAVTNVVNNNDDDDDDDLDIVRE